MGLGRGLWKFRQGLPNAERFCRPAVRSYWDATGILLGSYGDPTGILLGLMNLGEMTKHSDSPFLGRNPNGRPASLRPKCARVETWPKVDFGPYFGYPRMRFCGFRRYDFANDPAELTFIGIRSPLEYPSHATSQSQVIDSRHYLLGLAPVGHRVAFLSGGGIQSPRRRILIDRVPFGCKRTFR